MSRCLRTLILPLVFWFPLLGAQTPPLPELPEVNPADFFPVVREQVMEAYESVLSHPMDADANGRLGMLLDLYKKRESAAALYKRALLLDPKAFRWPYYLGSLQILQGKRAEAADTLRAALRLKPDDLPAGLKLAESLFAAGALDEAAALYELVVKQHPDAAEAYYGLGRIRAAGGDAKGSIEFLSRACELFPSYGAAHYALAQAYRKLGETVRADEELKLHATCKTLVPPVPDSLRDEMRALERGAPSLVQRGIAFQDAGRIDDAIAEHEKALELDPEYVLAHANLVILYGRAKQPQKAEEHFRAAVRINPNFADSYYNYGVLLFNERRDSEAEVVFRKAVEINPFHAQALHNLGYMRERQGKLDEAMEYYLKAIERQPDYPAAHFNIGRILVNRKDYDGAIRHFLLTLDPESESTPAYLYALSAAYARAGNWAEALKYGRRAREKAAAGGQMDLLRSIDRDLQALEKLPPR